MGCKDDVLMCWEQLNRPEVSASALQLGIEKWVGWGAQEQLQNKQKLENTRCDRNNNLVRNNEKKIMTPKSAKYEIKKKGNRKSHSAKAAPNNNLNYN